jgi:hypothetical protein
MGLTPRQRTAAAGARAAAAQPLEPTVVESQAPTITVPAFAAKPDPEPGRAPAAAEVFDESCAGHPSRASSRSGVRDTPLPRDRAVRIDERAARTVVIEQRSSRDDLRRLLRRERSRGLVGFAAKIGLNPSRAHRVNFDI